jgi:hypothetical protein
MVGINRKIQTARIFCILTALVTSCANADLVWEDEFTATTAIASGTVVNSSNIATTITTSVTGNATAPRGDHFMYRDALAGNHNGYFDMNMDTDQNNRNDELEVTFSFSDFGVADLELSVLDIDFGSWDDGVEISYTTFGGGGGDVRDDASLYTLPTGTTTVFLDNEANMHGFEGGFRNADVTETVGNLDLDFSGLNVTSLTLTFFSTDDAAADPGAQFIGISDFTFTAATPEPSAFILLLAAIGGISTSRPRRRNSVAGL